MRVFVFIRQAKQAMVICCGSLLAVVSGGSFLAAECDHREGRGAVKGKGIFNVV